MMKRPALAVLLVAVLALAAATADAGAPLQHGALHVDVPPEAPGAAPRYGRVLCSHQGGSSGTRAWSCANWAGTVTWQPAEVVVPESEAQLAAYLASLPKDAPLKVVGFAHSWAGLYTPGRDAAGNTGITLALHKLAGITRLTDTHVEVLAGTSFARLYAELHARGLTLARAPGGIQGLTVGGAAAVGFHGSQLSLGGVSSVVSALRVYDMDGTSHDLTDAAHPQQMRAARMGLGMCGIVSRVTLPIVAQHHLRRRRWRVEDSDDFMDSQLPLLKATYDRFHWYYHPATSSSWPMFWEPATAEESAAEAQPCVTALEQHGDAAMKEFGPDGLPLIMRWDNCSDVSHRALTHAIDMDAQPLWNGEYYVSLDDAGEAATVRAIVAAFNELSNGSPNPDIWLHTRYVGADDASLLNPCYGTAGSCQAFELALVAHTMDAPLPAWEEWARYFEAMERVLVPLGGRPHHAKYRSPHVVPPKPAFGMPVKEFRAQCAAFDPDNQLRSAAFDGLAAAACRTMSPRRAGPARVEQL